MLESREEFRSFLQRLAEDDLFIFYPRTAFGGGNFASFMEDLFERGCLYLLVEDFGNASRYLEKVNEYIDIGLERDDPRGFSNELNHLEESGARALMRFTLMRQRFLTVLLTGERDDKWLQEGLRSVEPWLQQYAYPGKTHMHRYELVHRTAGLVLSRLLTGQVQEACRDFETVVKPLPRWPRKSMRAPEREEAVVSMILSYLLSGQQEKRELFEASFDHFFRILCWPPYDSAHWGGLLELLRPFPKRLEYALFRAQYITGEHHGLEILRSLRWFEDEDPSRDDEGDPHTITAEPPI